VSVGRLVAHKRLDYLLESLREIREAVADVELDIVGDGPARESLEQLAHDLGVDDIVTFHGFVSEEEKRRLVSRGWVTAITSLSEGWGLTIVEANSLGVPAVGLDVPGVRDAIRHDRTGWLVPARDGLTPALVDALRILADPLERVAFAARAETWANGFSWKTTAEHLARVLLTEGDRLKRDDGDRRAASDVAIRMEIPRDSVEIADVAAVARRTDRWKVDAENVSLLLQGADEDAAARLLDRLGVDHDDVQMHVARPLDFLFGSADPVA
jgi:hypothetical protein